jgi:ribonuclease HI
MPDFRCQSCGTTFSLQQATLDKYPNWTPRTCRKCKPASSGGGSRPEVGLAYKARAQARTAGGGGRSSSSGASGGGRVHSATKEENLPVAEVLRRYTGGPQEGVFTDGACAPNPGPGGWGAVVVENGEMKAERHGHEKDTTNNRMEMTAIIAAFEMLPVDARVTVYSDSKLCIDTLDSWAKGWERAGWKRKTGPIKNLDLVQRAYALRKEHPHVKLAHISAHAGHRWNEVADALATAWMRDVL